MEDGRSSPNPMYESFVLINLGIVLLTTLKKWTEAILFQVNILAPYQKSPRCAPVKLYLSNRLPSSEHLKLNFNSLRKHSKNIKCEAKSSFGLSSKTSSEKIKQ